MANGSIGKLVSSFDVFALELYFCFISTTAAVHTIQYVHADMRNYDVVYLRSERFHYGGGVRVSLARPILASLLN